MEAKAAMPTGTSEEAQAALQQQLAGDDVLLLFALQGQSDVFHQEVFKQGVTFEWVKNKVAEKLETKYQNLTLFFNDKRVLEPFSIVDMPAVVSGSTLIV